MMLDRVRALAAAVPAADPEAAAAAAARHARLAKPPGSLGALEVLGARLAATAGRCPPPVPHRPAAVIACGDHGVHARGVSAWPQAVTTIMAGMFCRGGAACSVLAEGVGARLVVLDAGMAGDPAPHPTLRSAKIRRGTRDLTARDAMTADEVARAVLAGAGVAEELAGSGTDLIVVGDMGIANTTASAALVAALTGADAGDVTGPGAGGGHDVLERKREAVAGALARWREGAGRAVDRGRDGVLAGRDGAGRCPDGDGHAPLATADPLSVLAALGGFEHAALVGIMLRAAGARIPVVLDGLITDAAALVACSLAPRLVDHLVAGHRSVEPGAAIALDHLGLEPLLDLRLRLGEGSGGLLAVPLVQAAARLLAGMVTLDDLELASDGG